MLPNREGLHIFFHLFHFHTFPGKFVGVVGIYFATEASWVIIAYNRSDRHANKIPTYTGLFHEQMGCNHPPD